MIKPGLQILSLFLLAQGLAPYAFAGLSKGQVPSVLTLDGDEGGRVSGGSWSSAELVDKVWLVLYIDPDERALNDDFINALKKEALPPDVFASVAIINMAATWLPNFAINNTLKAKQEEFPYTIYVKDMNSILVKSWSLADHNYCVLLFNQKGQLIYRKDGKVSKTETKSVIALIKETMKHKETPATKTAEPE